MITAIGGIASATADITTAAMTEYSRTTAQASTNMPTQTAISMKYSRSRHTARPYPKPASSIRPGASGRGGARPTVLPWKHSLAGTGYSQSLRLKTT